jgi:hypothetical protein
MDEVPVYYDMINNRIVDKIGTKHPVALTTGSEKRRITVVLCCSAVGTAFPPMVIFKGKNVNHKSIRTIVHQRETVIQVQPKAWMCSELMLIG